MSREEIVALAEKAGFERLFPGNEDWVCFTEEIERFYKMVVAAERDALAKESSDTQQPAQQWVGLTDAEIDDIETTWEATQEWVSFRHATRVIEANLREKNT